MKHRISVIKGIEDKINYELEYKTFEYYPIKKEEIKDLEIIIETSESLEAPIEEKMLVGKCKVLLKDAEIASINIVASESIARKGIFDYLMEITSFILNTR